MIQPNELRIGVIVTVDNPKHHPKLKDVPLKVIGVEEKVIEGAITHSVRLEHINQKVNMFYETYSQFIKFIHPIPLTEEILLKCGFEKYKMLGYDTHFTYSLFIGGETINITAIYNADFSIMLHGLARGIKYLHRLQNIINIVTGKDLEINL